MRHILSKAEINGCLGLCDRKHCFPRFEIIRGRDDCDIMDGPQCGKIVQRVVRRTERAIAHAGADSHDLNRTIE